MSSGTLEKWVVCRRPKPDASVRLFCAAWAGGSASAFNKWPNVLPDAVELRALQLPGRMSRSKEDPLTSIDTIAEGAAKALMSMGLLDKPFALFGHSMGSLIMFELARKLQQDAHATPICLVVSGCRPPNLCVGEPSRPQVSQLPRDALVDHLINLGGMPAELRDQAELVNYFLPPIRADYMAFECYRSCAEEDSALTCPIVCLGGEADAGTPRGDLEHWANYTTGEFRLCMFDGGHFFLKDEGEATVLSFLSETLMAMS